MTNTNKIAAEIALYGCRASGFDYLACTPGADGRPVFTPASQPDPEVLRYDTLTEAIWRADRELRERLAGREIAIYAPGGEQYTIARIGSIPSAGSLAWLTVPAADGSVR